MEDVREEDQTFEYNKVKKIIEAAIDPVLADHPYDAKKVHDWTSLCIEDVLKGLQMLQKPFKYVVTCIIMQKNGAGLHTASTCYWDASNDASCSVNWTKNDYMHCIVSVFALHT